MAAANAANQKPDVRKDKDFIDFSMPPPKKITLPKVEIKKDFGPLPFQVYFSTQTYPTFEPESLLNTFSTCAHLNMMVNLNQTTWLPDHHLLLDISIAWTTVPWLQMVADHGMLLLPLVHKHSEESNHQQLELLLEMLNKSKTCQNNPQVNIPNISLKTFH